FALALLSAPMALGTVLGAPAAFSLAVLATAWVAARRGAGFAAGLAAGAAIAADHRAMLAAPFVVLAAEEWPRQAGRTRPLFLRRALAGGAAAYGLVVLPVALLDPAAFAAALGARAAPGPGLGLVNLLAYRGGEASPAAFALAAIAPLLAAGLGAWLWSRPWPPLAGAAIASLGWLVLAPAASPEAVALPLVLLGLAAIDPPAEPGRASAP
ncbi:MAG TPA: hypothetical protein VGB87_12915, partial [Vicinamibacteria bacterium]